MNMIPFFWLLMILGPVDCQGHDSAPSIEIGNSISPTFAKVRRIIRRDSSLAESGSGKIVTALPSVVTGEMEMDKSDVTGTRKRRQQGSSTVITSSPTSPTTESSVNLTSEAPSTTTIANLLALEESFGGTTRAPDPVIPANRKNGLYFLVDWNTFLELGEEGQKEINLRFQPKAGERSRFLSVTVP